MSAAALTIAQRDRSIVPLYRTEQDEDDEETGEDVTRDDSWNYAEICSRAVLERLGMIIHEA